MHEQQKANALNDWAEIKSSISHQLLRNTVDYELLADMSSMDLPEYKDYKQAAHVFIWAHDDRKVWDGYDCKAAVLMQMRFDGQIGFPGGCIDEDDKTIEDGLNRELKEEMNLNEKYFLNHNDYFVSHVCKKTKLILHFYVKSVSHDVLKEIERDSLDSIEWGKEMMGLIRVPLFKIYWSDKYDGGLPRFIQNNFAGNSLYQLLTGLMYANILTKDDIVAVLLRCQCPQSSSIHIPACQ